MNKIYISRYELKHYASPYYDPAKAHEYYEEHKKLKGRTSGRTLTDQGKEAKMYVTDQIKKAKKAVSEKAEADQEKAKTDRDNALNNSKTAHQREVDILQNELLSMTKDELKKKGPMYKRRLAKLRQQNSDEKNKAKQEYSDKIKSIRETNKAKQEELSNTLKSELEKMLLDPSTSQESNSSKSSKKSKNKTSTENVRPSSVEAQERIRKTTEMMKKKKEE